ncbi:WD repeat-containing protein 73 isoform X2 [Scyliorhinus canicula]|uniref:WD repeat-containing protein 73 isoform X2 n=1 Tax=Scyliorhinus canicula TaxID=7830 RepID=UPI0018F3D8AF|nr:WD repeat-containing protein 73 isoform X2 [Scyliorhinus canicula]
MQVVAEIDLGVSITMAVDHSILAVCFRYKDLHVFELQESTRVIEWIQDRSICVAGCTMGKKNEILELSLPQKLYAKGNQGLCPERDFTVKHGSFSERPIYELKHVAGTSLLVSSGPPDTSLQVWRLATDESDAIILENTVQHQTAGDQWSKISVNCSPTPRVLHGSKVSNLTIQEIASQKVLFTTGGCEPEPISDLEFLDHFTFSVCSRKGHLWLADSRQRPSLIGCSDVPVSREDGCHWTMGWAPGHSKVARLCSDGRVLLSDYRDLSRTLGLAELVIPTAVSNSDYLSLTWAPYLQDHLAVSGFNGTVHVYDTSSWLAGAGQAEPTFVHRGHSVIAPEAEEKIPLITRHAWHPWKRRVLLSTADDCSLHVWHWVDHNTA